MEHKILAHSDVSSEDILAFDNWQKQFQKALIEAGYDSQEKIVNLVQEIKLEMVIERQQKFEK